jgi:hypothetical protein
MDTGAIIAIVAGAVVLLLLVAWVLPRLNQRRDERLRGKADEERYQARDRELSAERTQAVADEKAARARQQAAQAEQNAREASRQRELAGEHHERARDLDPDWDGNSDDSRDRDSRYAENGRDTEGAEDARQTSER